MHLFVICFGETYQFILILVIVFSSTYVEIKDSIGILYKVFDKNIIVCFFYQLVKHPYILWKLQSSVLYIPRIAKDCHKSNKSSVLQLLLLRQVAYSAHNKDFEMRDNTSCRCPFRL